MARPTKEESRDRVDKILDAAAELFAEKGINATTVAEIADKCGIRAPSVLHYFGTKEGIFKEVVRLRLQRYFLEEFDMDAVDLSRPIDDTVRSALEAGIKVWKKEPKLIAAAFAELIRPGGMARETVNELLMPLVNQFETVAKGTIGEDLPIREIALMFVFSLAGRFSMLGDEPNLWGPEPEVFAVLDIILQGIRLPASN